jgi:hypothetical protein
MSVKIAVGMSCIVAVLFLAGCSDARVDPCRLLTVEDVRSVDDSVAVSLWAGRGGERKDNEVCMFYTDAGDPRVMLFVWYDSEKDPKALVAKGQADAGATVVDVAGAGSNAAAAFRNDELKLLAVKSSQGVVGLRIRKPVSRDGADFDEAVRLAETALSRNQ